MPSTQFANLITYDTSPRWWLGFSYDYTKTNDHTYTLPSSRGNDPSVTYLLPSTKKDYNIVYYQMSNPSFCMTPASYFASRFVPVAVLYLPIWVCFLFMTLWNGRDRVGTWWNSLLRFTSLFLSYLGLVLSITILHNTKIVPATVHARRVRFYMGTSAFYLVLSVLAYSHPLVQIVLLSLLLQWSWSYFDLFLPVTYTKDDDDKEIRIYTLFFLINVALLLTILYSMITRARAVAETITEGFQNVMQTVRLPESVRTTLVAQSITLSRALGVLLFGAAFVTYSPTGEEEEEESEKPSKKEAAETEPAKRQILPSPPRSRL